MTVGMLRVKDEARWIARVIQSIQPLCDFIYVFDDHSTDETRDICRAQGVYVIPSQFEGTNESRDKDYLLTHYIRPLDPDWVIAIDGDEVLTEDSVPVLRSVMARGDLRYLSFRVLYLWDSEDQIRVDGVYGGFSRPSMLRIKGQPPHVLSYGSTNHGANFHCGNVPADLIRRGGGRFLDGVKLLHYGYLHKEDRIRKYSWYREKDPNSIAEDGYRHVCQGDLEEIPAEMTLKHAGPLKLQRIT